MLELDGFGQGVGQFEAAADIELGVDSVRGKRVESKPDVRTGRKIGDVGLLDFSYSDQIGSFGC